MGVCNCSMFCCTLLYVHSSFAIILMGKRGLVALLSFSSWCLLMVMWLFLTVPWVCLRFVVVVLLDHTYLLYFRFNLATMGLIVTFQFGLDARKTWPRGYKTFFMLNSDAHGIYPAHKC